MIAIHVASDMDAVQSLDGDAVRALELGEQRPLTITRAEFDHAVDVLTRRGFPIEGATVAAREQFRAARRSDQSPAAAIHSAVAVSAAVSARKMRGPSVIARVAGCACSRARRRRSSTS